MSIDIAEFIDAELERSVRAERARERRAPRRTLPWQGTLPWQEWLGLAAEPPEDEADRD